MLTDLQDILTNLAILFCGFAIGSIWTGVIVVPNKAFDHLKSQDADKHVREVIRAGSLPVSAFLSLAAILSALGGAYGAAALAGLAAFGFLTNLLTLANGSPDTTNGANKSQRILAVALSLIFAIAALAAGILAALGI
jgi:hypothetical protein